MNKIRNYMKELVVLTILLAAATSMVNAAVFVYYPIEITAQWVRRPIYFDTAGTNAGGPDIGGTITVSLSEEDTSASITVNPSRRGTTLYHNIMKIKCDSNEGRTYYLWIKVNTAFDEGAIDQAYLIVGSAQVNLKATGSVVGIGSINPGGELSVSLRLKISSTTTGSDSASIELVYSPQSTESPP